MKRLACAIVTSLALAASANAANILKLDLGTAGPDIEFDGMTLSTIDDGEPTDPQPVDTMVSPGEITTSQIVVGDLTFDVRTAGRLRWLITRRANFTVTAGDSAIFSAISRAVVSSTSGATTRDTMP